MKTTTTDISSLIGLARIGDGAAFEQIVRRYQGLVSGVLFSVTGDFHKSEDLAQETFLIAWNKLGELEKTENPGPWLCTIARNLASQAFRKKTVDTAHGSFEGEIASPEPGPPDELHRREQSELVWSAIGEMDEKYRETLILYYRSDRSVKEIAGATASTEEAVRQRLVRARKSLKSKLEEIIGGILTDTAPGDVFTFGVMTAVAGGMISIGAGTAIAGTTTAATTTATATGAGSVGTSVVSTVALPVATAIGSQAIAGGMLWASIRNLPTLQSRRLQVNNFLWGCQYFGWLLAGAMLMLLMFPHLFSNQYGLLPGVLSQLLLWGIVMPITAYFNHRGSNRLREMLEYELGLPGPTPRLYTFQEVRRRFRSCVISNILLLESIPLLALLPIWYDGHLDDFGLSAMNVGMFTGLGIVLLAYSYGLGKSFLGMCRDRESFLKTPPLIKEPLKAVLQRPQGYLFVDRSSRMAWLNWAPLILIILPVVLMLPIVLRSESRWIPGFCLAVVVLSLPFQVYWIRKAKSLEQAVKRTIASELAVLAALLVLFLIEYGFSPSEWVRQTGEGDMLGIFVLVFVGMTALLLPGQLLVLSRELQRSRRLLESGRLEAMQEAVEHFDPGAFVDDEPAPPPERFPKRWIAVFVLYGLAVVGVIGLGVHFPSSKGYYWRANRRDSSERRLAIQDLDAAIARNPRFAEAYGQRACEQYFLGSDLMRNGQEDEAKTLFAKVIVDSDEARRLGGLSKMNQRFMQNARANAFEELEQWETAAEEFGELIRLEPGSMINVEKRARIYERLGEIDKAEADQTELIRLADQPESGGTVWWQYFKRAEFYERTGVFEKALADYDEAIRLYKETPKGKTDESGFMESYRKKLQERLDKK